MDQGTYWLAAFEDVKGNGRYNDESALRLDPAQPIVLGAEEQRRDVPADTQRCHLPGHTSDHSLFGFRGGSGDGVVPIASQLRAEAQEEARSPRGFDAGHTGILHHLEAIAHLNRLLGSP
ncbi:MAG: hypothetical protein IAE82_02690 [Opitutaceae bacterium]|nr:hypothetical protein [Opitutaceae bacterium]